MTAAIEAEISGTDQEPDGAAPHARPVLRIEEQR
jgi:hypothetical protein